MERSHALTGPPTVRCHKKPPVGRILQRIEERRTLASFIAIRILPKFELGSHLIMIRWPEFIRLATNVASFPTTVTNFESALRSNSVITEVRSCSVDDLSRQKPSGEIKLDAMTPESAARSEITRSSTTCRGREGSSDFRINRSSHNIAQTASVIAIEFPNYL